MEYFYSWGLLFVLPFTIFTYVKSNKREIIKMIISGIGFGILSCLFAGILPVMHNIIRKKPMTGKFKINYSLIAIYVLILIAVFYIMTNIFLDKFY